MAKARLVGSDALIEGEAFDLRKVIDACDTFVAALARKLGVALPVLTMQRRGAPRLAWPEPGRASSEAMWQHISKTYDVVDEPIVYLLGEVTLKAYLMGKSWATYQRATGKVLGPRGLPLSEFDPTPTICVYGEYAEDFTCGVLTPAVMDDVEDTVEELTGIGLHLKRVNVDTERQLSVFDKTQLAFITFPHAAYGKGRKDLLVRCVCDDGSEIDAQTAKPLN